MGLGRLNPKTCARFWSTRRTLVLVLPALALTLSACDWTQFGGWHENGGGRSTPDTGISLSNAASTTLDWTATTSGEVNSSPAEADGIVYVGSEDDKGTELTKATRALFLQGPLASRFVGNVEGRDIYEGNARVVVCEGFVGNVLLKAGEGAVDFLFSALKQEMGRLLQNLPPETGMTLGAGLKELKTRFEYQEFGGGPLLGIKGACIICHGSSRERAIKNALRVAGTMAEERVNAELTSQLSEALKDLPGS